MLGLHTSFTSVQNRDIQLCFLVASIKVEFFSTCILHIHYSIFKRIQAIHGERVEIDLEKHKTAIRVIYKQNTLHMLQPGSDYMYL